MTSDPHTNDRVAQSVARKDDHIRLALEQRRGPAASNDFDYVEPVHHALDGIDIDEVTLDVDVDGWVWPAPIYINGMTGGTDNAERANRALAIAARENGMPIASGSLSIALDAPETAPSFRVIREENPNGLVFANLGAGRSPDDAARAVDLLEANALQLHLNAVQETIMREGSRGFSTWLRDVERIVEAAEVPVIIKEVGFGLSGRVLRQLRDLGVRIADVSGAGGTSFARIEDERSGGGYTYMHHYGQSAVNCLLDAPADFPAVLASGGVRSPLDVIRALALGARAVGVAGPFLVAAVDGDEETAVNETQRWLTQTRQLLALLGARTPAAATGIDVLLRGRVREFCELRGIDPAAFARRTYN